MFRNAVTLTRDLAYSAGHDAGNRAMRQAGRSAWNVDDYNVAAERTVRLAILGGFLHVGAYEDLGFGVFPYAQDAAGGWAISGGHAAEGEMQPCPNP